MKAKNLTIGCKRTTSRQYQSKSAEFAMDLFDAEPSDILDGHNFAKAVVDNNLSIKTGMTRKELNRLSKKFTGVLWSALTKGTTDDEEVL